MLSIGVGSQYTFQSLVTILLINEDEILALVSEGP